MYIPLNNKTSYSLLSSLISIDDLINYAKKNNLKSIAIADENMYAVAEFITKCRNNDINPVVGLEVKVEDSKIVLYAKDYKGYQNLIKLSTISSKEKLTLEDLIEYNSNLIAVIPYKYKNDISKIEKIYEDTYLGYTNKEEELNALLLTKNVVFFRENLYLEENNKEELKYIYLIRDGKTSIDNIIYDIDNHSLNIKNIYNLTDNTGLINTIKISDSINIELPKLGNLLPIYPVENSDMYLFELSKKGLYKRLNNNVSEVYKKRLTKEIEIISKMGFSNYFLVVYDYIKYAKKSNILVGPGRGSAVGSLVAYTLGITDIDPIKYGLLFERFLNPERKSMPDIDTDFPDTRRDEVIDYCKKKYGENQISGIVAFGTLAAKQAMRDVARVMNIPPHKIDGLSKFITFKSKLKEVYNNNPTFKARIDSDITLTKMFNVATKLEGIPRHTMTHPSGIVICNEDISNLIPLTYSDGMYLSAYTNEYIEPMGFYKMDFLGLINLTTIDEILKDIKNYYNEEVSFKDIPLDDKETIKVFSDASTCGIFQFESEGMRSFLKRLEPNTFEDILSAIALFRPGAAENIPSFIRRRHKEEKITYINNCLEEVLKETYGIMVYQEQIIEVARIYAGYTLGEADLLRRAVSKKKVDLLKSNQEEFISKSVSLGRNKEEAKRLFDLILKFAGYGFNKSHSVAYSLIAYKQAYLKKHYPLVFFKHLLTSVIGSESKTSEYIKEASSEGINIIKPTINLSEEVYSIKDNSLVFPLSNIKSIGKVTSSTILEERKNGVFTDIYNAISRLTKRGIGIKTLETLVYAGVFKEFSYNRATLMYNLDNLFNYGELTKDMDENLVPKPEIDYQKDYSDEYLLEKEKELFGFYLSNHPTKKYEINNPDCIKLNTIKENLNKRIKTLVLVERTKVISTKNNEKMMFVTASDSTSNASFTLFPQTYIKYADISRGDLLKIEGKVERRLSEYQIIVDKITNLKEEK